MKFNNVSCSHCGRSFGPGDHGFSHCEDHPGHVADMALWREQLLQIAAEIHKQAETIDVYRDDPDLVAQFLRPSAASLRGLLADMRRPARRRP